MAGGAKMTIISRVILSALVSLFVVFCDLGVPGKPGLSLEITSAHAARLQPGYRLPRAQRYRAPRTQHYRPQRTQTYRPQRQRIVRERAPRVRRSNGGFNNVGGRAGRTIRNVANRTTTVRKQVLGR
jgi:hypothetical protein